MDGDTPADFDNYTRWDTLEPNVALECVSTVTDNDGFWTSRCCDCLPDGDEGYIFACDVLRAFDFR